MNEMFADWCCFLFSAKTSFIHMNHHDLGNLVLYIVKRENNVVKFISIIFLLIL